MKVTPDHLVEWSKHAGSSPLYAYLALVIADTDSLMRVINRIEHTPQANVLLAGVQFLLARRPDHPLARFYPSLEVRPRPVGEAGAPFIDFVLEHEDDLVELGRQRHTQTNEARRCVALLPGIWAGGLDRFHLVDVGSSVGLNLALDYYRYRWDGIEWGPESAVVLETELRAVGPEPRAIAVLSRTGLDLVPVDPADRDDRDWLEALIWPEAEERRRRFRRALTVAARVRMRQVAGNAVETLPGVLESLPPGEPAVVMNSFSFNQLSTAQRSALEDTVTEARSVRPVHRVWLELIDVEGLGADLRIDSGEGWVALGRAEPHGEWLELYERPTPVRRPGPTSRS